MRCPGKRPKLLSSLFPLSKLRANPPFKITDRRAYTAGPSAPEEGSLASSPHKCNRGDPHARKWPFQCTPPPAIMAIRKTPTLATGAPSSGSRATGEVTIGKLGAGGCETGGTCGCPRDCPVCWVFRVALRPSFSPLEGTVHPGCSGIVLLCSNFPCTSPVSVSHTRTFFDPLSSPCAVLPNTPKLPRSKPSHVLHAPMDPYDVRWIQA